MLGFGLIGQYVMYGKYRTISLIVDPNIMIIETAKPFG